ncbi:MAG: 5-dehydro-4-deoxy-D-glucuronate isomerase [Acidobacteriota bacterium]
MNPSFHIVQSCALPGPVETARLGTAELRHSFLVEHLFKPSELRVVLTDMDRLVLGGAMPTAPLRLEAGSEFGTAYFAERRELGIVNLGEPGHVFVEGERYSLANRDFLYVGAGNREISFASCEDSRPCFYFLSCPAHQSLPVVHVPRDEAQSEVIGDAGRASRRRLSKYIHPEGARSCQLVMGLTELEDGSVWNTMPPHTHSRRSEIYLYFGLEDGVAVHLMGEPTQTRHLIVRDREAILSPSWSMHSGAGTRPYSFIWGMAGENQAFSDMDAVDLHQLR